MCHLCGGRNSFFVREGCFIFLGSACVSPSWSAGHCQNTAKLSAEYGRSKSLVRMSKVDGFGVSLMVVVSSNRLACNGCAWRSGGFRSTKLSIHHKS